MKKKLLAVLAALMIFSTAAFAGPTLGMGIIPVAGFPAVLTLGYDFGDISVEMIKEDLTTPDGLWALGALWTPNIETFGYRVGARIALDWQGIFVYDGFGVVLGVSKTWGPVQIYGELDLFPTGILQAIPILGVNILFSELIPEPVE